MDEWKDIWEMFGCEKWRRWYCLVWIAWCDTHLGTSNTFRLGHDFHCYSPCRCRCDKILRSILFFRLSIFFVFLEISMEKRKKFSVVVVVFDALLMQWKLSPCIHLSFLYNDDTFNTGYCRLYCRSNACIYIHFHVDLIYFLFASAFVRWAAYLLCVLVVVVCIVRSVMQMLHHRASCIYCETRMCMGFGCASDIWYKNQSECERSFIIIINEK